ncbi:hypothetical protein BC831DRAFT_160954 [Entophlyctis helioformis]|nr:hypothetical protein BC831DRAFT_160954 [Entophlyctis helioformis]
MDIADGRVSLFAFFAAFVISLASYIFIETCQSLYEKGELSESWIPYLRFYLRDPKPAPVPTPQQPVPTHTTTSRATSPLAFVSRVFWSEAAVSSPSSTQTPSSSAPRSSTPQPAKHVSFSQGRLDKHAGYADKTPAFSPQPAPPGTASNIRVAHINVPTPVIDIPGGLATSTRPQSSSSASQQPLSTAGIKPSSTAALATLASLASLHQQPSAPHADIHASDPAASPTDLQASPTHKPALFKRKQPPSSPPPVVITPENVLDHMPFIVALPFRVADTAWDMGVCTTARAINIGLAPARFTSRIVGYNVAAVAAVVRGGINRVSAATSR